MALNLFTWYHHKMSCRRKSPRREFTSVVVPWREFTAVRNLTTVSCKRETTTHVSVWDRSASRLERVAHALCLRFWITRVFYKYKVHPQITRYKWPSHHVNVIRNQKVIPVWNSRRCNVFSCKHPLTFTNWLLTVVTFNQENKISDRRNICYTHLFNFHIY